MAQLLAPFIAKNEIQTTRDTMALTDTFIRNVEYNGEPAGDNDAACARVVFAGEGK